MYEIRFYRETGSGNDLVDSMDGFKTYEAAEAEGIDWLDGEAPDNDSSVVIVKEVARITQVDEYETETL